MLRGDPLQGQAAANAAGWIRSQGDVTLASGEIPRLRDLPTPRVSERGRFLIEYLASKCPTPGEEINVQYGDLELQAVTRCSDIRTLHYTLREYLIKARGHLIPFTQGSFASQVVIISPDGWAYLDTSRRRARHSPFAFVAMRFGEETAGLREDGIRPAVIAAGFDTRIMDEVDHNRHIDDAIIASIRRSRFLIADLTLNRQNVYYEAGFAQGLGLEVIWTIRADHLEEAKVELHPHLDVRQFLFVPWAHNALADFRVRLTNRIIRTVGPGPKTPAA